MSSLSSAAAPAQAARAPLRLSNLGDELLARYAARGSDRAFTVLYERYHQQLYRYCRSILRDDTDAQDALQSTFAGALVALRRKQRSAPLRPWLYKIAHNEAISLLRRRRRDAAEELDVGSLVVGGSVEQEVSDRAEWRTLVADLGGLPDRQRAALLLRELSGLSHEEIAIALGSTTAAAKQTIFEARQALIEIQEGRAMSCEEVRRRVSDGDRRVLRGRRVSAHLRECAACQSFALAIPARRARLEALAPALPPAAAATLLSRSLRAASSHAGSGGTSAAATAGVAGKAAGSAIAWKTLAGVALVATTAAGATGIRHLIEPGSPASPAAAASRHLHSGARGGNSSGAQDGSSVLPGHRTFGAGAPNVAGSHHRASHRTTAAAGDSTAGSTANKSRAVANGKSHGQGVVNSHGQSNASSHGQAHSNGGSSSGSSSTGHGQSAQAHGSTAHGPRVHVHVRRRSGVVKTTAPTKLLTLAPSKRVSGAGTRTPSR